MKPADSIQDLQYFGSDQYQPVILVFLIALLAPNVQQIFRKYSPVLGKVAAPENFSQKFQWRPDYKGLALVIILAIASLISLSTVNEFLYFRF